MPAVEIPTICKSLSRSVATLQPFAAPMFKSKALGFLESLNGDTNLSRLRPFSRSTTMNGHYMKYFVTGTKRSTAEEVSDEITCEPGNDIERNELEISSPLVAEFSVKFQLDNLVRFCEDATATSGNPLSGLIGNPVMNQVYMDIVSQTEGIRDFVDQALLTDALTSIRLGVAPFALGFTAIDLIDSANGSALQTANSQLRRMAAAVQMGMPLQIVGQGVIEDYFANLDIGCCNNLGGDFSKVKDSGRYNFWLDSNSNTQLGAVDRFFAYEPGAYQFLYANFYEPGSPAAGQHGIAYNFILPDPILPGLMYDAQMYENPCGQNGLPELVVTLRLRFGLFKTMEDAYKSTDDLFNFQGSLGFLGQEA